MQEKFLRQITDFIFVENPPTRADLILIPGSGYPQIAEEAAELAKAALKLRRAITQTNPTPVTVDEAVENIIEEYADTIGAFAIWTAKCDRYGARIIGADIVEMTDKKYARKARQIKEGKKHGERN